MFSKVSRTPLLLLLVLACAATAVFMRSDRSQEGPQEENNAQEEHGTPNQDCNNEDGQRTTNEITCRKEGFACINPVFMFRQACTMCATEKRIEAQELVRCNRIAQKHKIVSNIFKAVKVFCDTEAGCEEKAFPAVYNSSKFGGGRTIKWEGKITPEDICGCVKGFIDVCDRGLLGNKKGFGFRCVMNKFEQCAKVCPSVKDRITDSKKHSRKVSRKSSKKRSRKVFRKSSKKRSRKISRKGSKKRSRKISRRGSKKRSHKGKGSSFVQAKDKNELKDRAGVLVDAHGKTLRNASVSLSSLDHAVSGKCSQ